ncbi:MAG: DUF4160 domain-containing protein [Planctomycetota bacterium]
MHVHAICGDGEAKYWLKPDIELARNHRLSRAIEGSRADHRGALR